MKLFLQLLCFTFLFGIYAAEEDLYMLVPNPPPAPPQCPLNEMYQQCLRNCSNCELRGYCPIRECTQSGCDCIPSFVRLVPGGPCVHISNCPIQECGENEVYRECGPLCEKCGTMNCRVVHCEHKCYCKSGYKRDVHGKCIAEDDCPPRDECPMFEEMRDSGLSDEFCLHHESEDVSDIPQNKTQCYCVEGFKRNGMGHCMNETFCDGVFCQAPEIYHPCHRKCNATCKSYGDTSCVEDGHCYPGCFCPEGLVMNEYRMCVRPEQCPPGSNPFAMTLPPVIETTLPASVFTGKTSEEDITTPSPPNEATTNSAETTVTETTVTVQSTKTISEKEDGDLPDEDVPSGDEEAETTQVTVTPSPAPKKKAGKRPISSKSLARKAAKASAKAESVEK